ncbi:MAG TPA: hypothetical protein VMF29_07610, partial [Candidatus Edwardsbacteria bacterium]|nr:hypothetical protein [Candidatus Edwardsbacteria bacterium]
MAAPNSKTALMACSPHWTSPYQVGSHHIARALVRGGWRVGFLSFPISPWHLLADPARTRLAERFAIYRCGGIADCGNMVWAYVPGALVAPYGAFPLSSRWVHRQWHRTTVPGLLPMLARHGLTDVDLLYIDNPYFGFLLPAIRHRRSLYRAVDNYSRFTYYAPAAAEQEAAIVRATDAVAYPAPGMRERLAAMGAHDLAYLPNGVDYQKISAGPRGR